MLFGVISYNGSFSSLSIRFTAKKVIELVDPNSFRVYMRTKLSQKGHAGNWAAFGPFPLHQFNCYFYIMGSLKGTTVHVKNFCIDDKKVQFFGDVLICFSSTFTLSDELNISSMEELTDTKISLILKYLESNSANMKTCICDILTCPEKKTIGKSKEDIDEDNDDELLSNGSVEQDFIYVDEEDLEEIKENNDEEEEEEEEEEDEEEEEEEEEDGGEDEEENSTSVKKPVKKNQNKASKKKVKGKKTKKQYMRLLDESKSGEMLVTLETYSYPFEYSVPEHEQSNQMSNNIWTVSTL